MDEHPICRAIGLFPGVSSRTCGRGEPTNGGLPCHLTQLLPLHQKSPLCLMPLSPQMVAIHTACARCLIFFEYTGNRLVYTSPHKSQEECVPKGVSKASPCFECAESIFGLGFTLFRPSYGHPAILFRPALKSLLGPQPGLPLSTKRTQINFRVTIGWFSHPKLGQERMCSPREVIIARLLLLHLQPVQTIEPSTNFYHLYLI